MAPEPEVQTVGHFTVTESKKGPDRVWVECGKCGIAMEVGESFGPIPGDVMIETFVKQHAHAGVKRRGSRRR